MPGTFPLTSLALAEETGVDLLNSGDQLGELSTKKVDSHNKLQVCQQKTLEPVRSVRILPWLPRGNIDRVSG